MNNIFLPKTITVGYQNRNDTYTGKLSYIIYTDEKGVLRKETSWNSWRNKNIEPQTFDNIPTSGFVLNKKVGGYNSGWNHRQTYIRVYDPRGFEFEISISNLLYILENTNSIKGKGLDGEFVYGWDGKDLVLMPTSSSDYNDIVKLNNTIHNKKTIKAKDLKIGAIYKTKKGEELIYMGRFDYYNYDVNKGKYYFFATYSKEDSWYRKINRMYCFEQFKSLNDKLIDVVSNDCGYCYSDMFNELERDTSYSPIDKNKNKFKEYTYDEFEQLISSGHSWGENFYSNKELYNIFYSSYRLGYVISKERKNGQENEVIDNLQCVFDKYKPCYKCRYLANGNLYSEDK